MSTKFVKKTYGRKRFIKTKAIDDLENWSNHLVNLKRVLSSQSGLQVMGSVVYFEVVSKTIAPKMMLEVMGVPLPLGSYELELFDLESPDVLIHKFATVDLFTLDFEELFLTSWELSQALEASFLNSQPNKAPVIFHIVFDNNKIELHFFSQKDYIQKQL